MMRFLMICLFCLWVSGVVYGELVGECPELSQPQRMVMDDQQVYVVDGTSVVIYSKEKCKFIKKFGKRGEGPGEFMMFPGNAVPMWLHVDSDSILVGSINRLSFFSKNGSFIREKSNIDAFLIRSFDKGFVAYENILENKQRLSCIFLYDKALDQKRRIFQAPSILERKKDKTLWHFFSKSFPGLVICKDKIWVVPPVNDFQVKVFSFSGKLLNTITHKASPVPFTEACRQRIFNHYKTNPSTRADYATWKQIIRLPKYFPILQSIHTDGTHVYIRTYGENNSISTFYVFNWEGVFIKKLKFNIKPNNIKGAFPFWRDSAPFTFNNGWFYQLEENSDQTDYELHRYTLN